MPPRRGRCGAIPRCRGVRRKFLASSRHEELNISPRRVLRKRRITFIFLILPLTFWHPHDTRSSISRRDACYERGAPLFFLVTTPHFLASSRHEELNISPRRVLRTRRTTFFLDTTPHFLASSRHEELNISPGRVLRKRCTTFIFSILPLTFWRPHDTRSSISRPDACYKRGAPLFFC